MKNVKKKFLYSDVCLLYGGLAGMIISHVDERGCYKPRKQFGQEGWFAVLIF